MPFLILKTTAMSNSFYYFFSATPQVLGAILALFGVFVIFKIEAIKSQLKGIGQSIIKDMGTNLKDDFLLTGNTVLRDKAQKSDSEINDIKMSIFRNDINGLKSDIDKLDKVIYSSFQSNYNEVYKSLKSLICNTIIWSILTIVVILGCLTILSQGGYFLTHCSLLSYTIWIIIGLICTCFSGLIYILIKSLTLS
jgi:TRAP-type uncharacterized transport system fused permease subunit